MRMNKSMSLLLGLCILSFAFAAESFALQQARPVSDIRTGNWSPSTLYTTVDETSANDSDYMWTYTYDDIAELRLDNNDYDILPPVPGPKTLRIRARTTGRFSSVQVALLSNGIRVGNEFSISLNRSWITTELPITESIPNYETLSVRFTYKPGRRSGSGQISWVELEVPDAPALTVPRLSSPTSSAITQTTATLGATLTDRGSSAVTEWGVVWSTSPNPTIASKDGSCTANDPYIEGNSFTCGATGLTLDTAYYFAGYARNSQGYGYSGQGQFTTEDKLREGHNYDVGPLLSTPVTMINCDTCHALHSGVVPTGDEVFTACEKCHVAGGEADSMSSISNHVVTRESDGATVVVDCGMCHEMHKNNLISEDNHTGGSTAQNKSYIRVDMTKYISGASSEDTIFHNNFNGVPISGEQPKTYSYGNDSAPYNGVCQSCHTDTKYHKNDGTADEHKKDTNCSGCHVHNISGTIDAFKGRGHTQNDTHVKNSPNCEGCHPTDTDDPVMEIHRENCAMCHVNPAGDGPLQEPWETDYPNGGTCEDCHFSGSTVAQRATGHHNFARTVPAYAAGNGIAQKGLCVNCHEADVNQPGTSRVAGNLDMPKGLPCNWCHLFWGGGSSTECNNVGSDDCNGNNEYKTDGDDKVKIYSLDWDPNTSPLRHPAKKTVLATHTISKSLSPPISDYSACFACHGKTRFNGSKGQAPKVMPFHGLGTPYSSSSTNDWGTGGNLDDVINAYAGPTGRSAHTYSRHPGFLALNWLSEEAGKANTPGGRWNNPYSNRPQAHGADDANSSNPHRPIDATYYSASGHFNIPWDDYSSAEPSATGNIDVNVGGVSGTKNKQTIIQTVPLTLTWP